MFEYIYILGIRRLIVFLVKETKKREGNNSLPYVNVDFYYFCYLILLF